MDLRGSIKNLLDVCILADIVIDSVNENPYMIESIIFGRLRKEMRQTWLQTARRTLLQ